MQTVIERYNSSADGSGWVVADLELEAAKIEVLPPHLRQMVPDARAIILDHNWDGAVFVGGKVLRDSPFDDGRPRFRCVDASS